MSRWRQEVRFLRNPLKFQNKYSKHWPSGATGRHAVLRMPCESDESSNLSLATTVNRLSNSKTMQAGWRSSDSHKVGLFGSIPGSAIQVAAATSFPWAPIEYANWQSGHIESVAILWVRLPSRSLSYVSPMFRGDCVACEILGR